MQEVGEKARALIRSYCKWERRRPFTENDEDYSDQKQIFYKHYLSLRRNVESQANATSRDRPVNPTQVSELRDVYVDELVIMAEVSAYYRLASKRVFDMVPMMIENEYIQKFADELAVQLVSKLKLLGNGGAERCEMYLKEDEGAQRRRHDLIRRKQVLEAAAEIIRGIME